MKYIVYGRVAIGVAMDVEADSPDEAIDKAYENWPGISNYAGNGGTDKLVGVFDENTHLEADWNEAEFLEAEENED